jgi:glutamate dehydrogenase (NADP+)
MQEILNTIRESDPQEREFHQAAQEVIESVKPFLDRNPQYLKLSLLERILEPERVLSFRVPWMDDQGKVRINRGYRVEMNSAIGPYKGGLRFHPSVNLSILKFLAFEQTFKNALTTMPLGGAAGGSNFNPQGKSDDEVMRFCQSFMTELYRHIGADTDIPSADIGVGSREIGYLFGTYRKIANEFRGVITGKGLNWGGSLIRQQAAGYGCVYFAAEMLASRGETLQGKKCLLSGAGNVAQFTAEKLMQMGARVLTLSDSNGHIYDEQGLDARKMAYIKYLKNVRRGRIEEYTSKYPHAVYTEYDPREDHNPIWKYRADCAFPCATQNEIGEIDAYNLINNSIKLVCEGASMPCTSKAIEILQGKRILYAPGKAANAGGAAVSGLEMVQNSMRLNWLSEEVDSRLQTVMKNIHQTCLDVAADNGAKGNYLVGANIVGFVKVAEAMMDQGVV